MRSGTPGFQPARLVEAREARGLTQVALAELINRTSSSISRWESPEHRQSPEPEALEALARGLNVPVAFFLRSVPAHGDGSIFFRSMASATQAVRRRARARLRWAQDITLALQDWVYLPDVDVPCLDARDHRDIQSADIERAANECRTRWKLGSGPISDALLALENVGIVVTKEEIGTVSMDGLSNWSEVDGRPYMLVAKDKDTCVRSRLDAAHELGHLVLHRRIAPKKLNDLAAFKEIEQQAFAFAGAFLMPAESFAAEVWSPSLNGFVALKERWKTAVGAMIKRCESLGMISEEYQRRLWKHYSTRGWRKREPLDDVLVPEKPRLMARSVRLLADEGVRSRSDLLGDFRLHGSDVESLCGLPRGYMTSEETNVLELPRLRTKAAEESGPSGGNSVVQFNRRTES